MNLEHCAVINHLFLKVLIKRNMNVVHDESATSYVTVVNWLAEFKGR